MSVFCSKSVAPFLLALLCALPAIGKAWADTARMQQVATLLGIDSNADGKDTKAAEAAVDRLVELGLRHYPVLKIRQAELAARRAQVDAAKGLYQPNIRLSADTSQRRIKDFSDETQTRADTVGASLTLRENLWRGGQDAAQIAIAEQGENLAIISQENQVESVSFAIRKAVLDYNYRSLRQVIEEASLADAVDLSALARRKLSARQVGKIDIHTASMRESSAKASAARGAIQTRQAFQYLLDFLGPQENSEALQTEIKGLAQRALPFPADTPVLAKDKTMSFEEKNALAVQKRAELILQQGYRKRFMPQIDFVGVLSRNNQSSWLVEEENLKSQRQTYDSTLQLQMNWDLWDRTQDHQNRAAAADKAAATAQLDFTRYQTQTETQRLQTYIEDLHKTLAIVKEAYQEAGQLYDAQRKLYEAGVIGIQALVDAEREKRNAISAWHDNVYELQLNILRWQSLQRGYLSRGDSIGSSSE